MGAVTEMVRKSRLTAVVVVGAAFVLVDLGIVMPNVLRDLQAKAHAGGVDGYDIFIAIFLFWACVGKTIGAYVNKGFTRYADERDAEYKEQKRKADATQPPDPVTVKEGHLR